MLLRQFKFVAQKLFTTAYTYGSVEISLAAPTKTTAAYTA